MNRETSSDGIKKILYSLSGVLVIVTASTTTSTSLGSLGHQGVNFQACCKHPRNNVITHIKHVYVYNIYILNRVHCTQKEEAAKETKASPSIASL